MSGACSLKTCWEAGPSFRQIGDALKQLYRNAIQVQVHIRAYSVFFIFSTSCYCMRNLPFGALWPLFQPYHYDIQIQVHITAYSVFVFYTSCYHMCNPPFGTLWPSCFFSFFSFEVSFFFQIRLTAFFCNLGESIQLWNCSYFCIGRNNVSTIASLSQVSSRHRLDLCPRTDSKAQGRVTPNFMLY